MKHNIAYTLVTLTLTLAAAACHASHHHLFALQPGVAEQRGDHRDDVGHEAHHWRLPLVEAVCDQPVQAGHDQQKDEYDDAGGNAVEAARELGRVLPISFRAAKRITA